MRVQKLRLQRGWSQEQLSAISGLSVRTIQRIERGQQPGLESMRSLASIFEIDIKDLQTAETEETKMIPVTPTNAAEMEEALAFDKVRKVKGFYFHAAQYVVVISALGLINYLTFEDYIWVIWPALGWGVGLCTHATAVFIGIPFLGPDWEKRRVEKELGRKLE